MRGPRVAGKPDATDATRWHFGAYYLDQPHPQRGGAWYACRYDAGSRSVHRRSLRTADFEQAKRALVALAAIAPVRAEDAPHPKAVLTTAALDAYLTARGSQIRTEEYAIRAAKLVLEYLSAKGMMDASVAAWTPSRQIDFARWLNATYNHRESTIRRTFTVVAAAFSDAAKVKIRADPLGAEIEGSLMSHAPSFPWKEDAIRRELQLPATKRPTFVPTLDEMARFVDALETEHLHRWALLALATWARPEAVTDFDPFVQWDRRTNVIDLDPPGRAQTNKRRAKIVCCETLAASLVQWMQPRTFADRRRPVDTFERPALLLYKREPVGTVKRAVRRIADDIGIPEITQKTPRTFMATMVRKLAPAVPREKRSMWLGHSTQEGSRTTDHYEISDPEYLADVALATDYVLQQILSRCCNKAFAIEVRLKREDLLRIGAKPFPKTRAVSAG